ncbi:MAG: mannonate dehydratase [Planctomycetota bacterium]
MKLALLLPPCPDDSWTLAVQAGVRYAVTKPTSSMSGLGEPWEPGVAMALKRRFAERGLALLGFEGDPFDLSRVKLGRPGRDEDFRRYRAMLEAMGETGLGLLCFNFVARLPGADHDWSRTREDYPLRGGALATAFDLERVPSGDAGVVIAADAVWSNYAAFIRAVIPTAERAGVRMALHPDDPPLPELAGVSRVFGTVEAFERAHRLAPSPAHAVTFCQANFMLMPGRVEDHARRLADRVAFVHWRDVAGTAERFHETFHDGGPHDLAALLRLYHDLGLDVPIRVDHAPLMHGEGRPWMPGYGVHGRLLAAAYLRGIADGAGLPIE